MVVLTVSQCLSGKHHSPCASHGAYFPPRPCLAAPSRHTPQGCHGFQRHSNPIPSKERCAGQCDRTAQWHLSIAKRIGWHTFRRTYSSILKDNGEDVIRAATSLCRTAFRYTIVDAKSPNHCVRATIAASGYRRHGLAGCESQRFGRTCARTSGSSTRPQNFCFRAVRCTGRSSGPLCRRFVLASIRAFSQTRRWQGTDSASRIPHQAPRGIAEVARCVIDGVYTAHIATLLPRQARKGLKYYSVSGEKKLPSDSVTVRGRRFESRFVSRWWRVLHSPPPTL